MCLFAIRLIIITHTMLQADLASGVDIAYIELKDGQTIGYIRCKDALSARQIMAHTQEGLGFSLLSGKYFCLTKCLPRGDWWHSHRE